MLNKFSKRSKIMLTCSTIGILAITSITAIVLFAKKQFSKEQSLSETNLDDEIDHKNEYANNKNEDLFPKLNPKDYYDLIELKNGKPNVTKKFIASVIKDIIRGGQFDNGSLKFDYKITDDNNLIIYTQYFSKNSSEPFHKKYEFNFSYSV